MTTSTTSGAGATLSSTLFNRLAQDRLTKNFVFYRFADKKKFPKNSGQVMQFNRYSNVAGTTTTLTEGTLTAGEITLSANTATITPSPYGQFTTITQTLTDTNRTTMIEEATELLVDTASDTVDLLHMYNLLSNAKSRIVNGLLTSTITNADKLTADELRIIVRNMKANNVRMFDESGFVGIYNAYQTYDLQGDTAANSWVETHKYTQVPVQNIFANELGKLYGVRLIESNNVLTTSVTASCTNGAYQGFVLGNHSLAAVSIEQNPIEMIVKLPGSGGTSDPYNNICTVAYKLPYFGVQWLGFGTTNDSFRAYRHITAVSA